MRISDWSSDVCSSDLLLYITHGIKFARIKRHAIGWRHDARPVLICIVVKYFRIVAYKTDLSGISWCPQQLAAHIRAALFEYFLVEREVAPKSVSLVLVGDSKIDCETIRSEEHTSELQSLMRISYAVFCLKKKINIIPNQSISLPLQLFHLNN